MKKYSLKFKDIVYGGSPEELKKAFYECFVLDESRVFPFIDNKSKKHKCQIVTFKIEKPFIYGRFGEIKNANVENGVAMVNDNEIDDADFKYHVQFLINTDTNEIVYVYNMKASCFDDAFTDFVQNTSNIISFGLVNKSDKGLIERIRKAKKIKYINAKKNDPTVVNALFKEFNNEYSIFQIDTRITFKNKKGLSTDDVCEFIKRNENDITFTVAFTDEDGNELVKNFTDNLFFKSVVIDISPEDIKDKDYMFRTLKEKLAGFDNEN